MEGFVRKYTANTSDLPVIVSMRRQIREAMQLIEDVALNEQLPEDARKALLKALKLLSQAEDSLVEVKSQVRDITYTLQELAQSLGLDVKLSNPRLSIDSGEVLDLIEKSAVAELEIEDEKAVVKKLVTQQAPEA